MWIFLEPVADPGITPANFLPNFFRSKPFLLWQLAHDNGNAFFKVRHLNKDFWCMHPDVAGRIGFGQYGCNLFSDVSFHRRYLHSNKKGPPATVSLKPN